MAGDEIERQRSQSSGESGRFGAWASAEAANTDSSIAGVEAMAIGRYMEERAEDGLREPEGSVKIRGVQWPRWAPSRRRSLKR